MPTGIQSSIRCPKPHAAAQGAASKRYRQRSRNGENAADVLIHEFSDVESGSDAIDRSWRLPPSHQGDACIASMSSGAGRPAWLDLTMNMKRIGEPFLGRAAGAIAAEMSAN